MNTVQTAAIDENKSASWSLNQMFGGLSEKKYSRIYFAKKEGLTSVNKEL